MFIVNPYVTGGGAFSPSDIASISWWVDPDDSGSVTGSAPVTVVADQLGSGKDLQAVTSFGTPDLASSGGRNWLSFAAASTEAMRVADVSATEINFGTGEITIAAVFQTSSSTAQNILNKGSNVGGRYRLRSNHATGGDVQTVLNDGVDNFPLATGSTYDDGAPHLFLLIRDETASLMRIRIDGSEVATLDITALDDIDETSGSGWVATLLIGANPSGTSLNGHFDGLIGEIIFFKDALEGSELSSLEGYLIDKWGV